MSAITASTIIGVSVAAGTAGAGIYAAHKQADTAEKAGAMESKAADAALQFQKEEAEKKRAQDEKDRIEETRRYQAEQDRLKIEQDRVRRLDDENLAQYNDRQRRSAPYRQFGANALATLGQMAGFPVDTSAFADQPRIPAPASGGAPSGLPPGAQTAAPTPPVGGVPGADIAQPSSLRDFVCATQTPALDPAMAAQPGLSAFTTGPLNAPADATAAPPVEQPQQAPGQPPQMSVGDMASDLVPVRDARTGSIVRIPRRIALMMWQQQKAKQAQMGGAPPAPRPQPQLPAGGIA